MNQDGFGLYLSAYRENEANATVFNYEHYNFPHPTTCMHIRHTFDAPLHAPTLSNGNIIQKPFGIEENTLQYHYINTYDSFTYIYTKG